MTEAAGSPASISKRAAIGAGWIIAWRVATRNLGLLSTLILVRLLAPADFGLVALATGFISSVDALSAIGVQDALVRDPSPDRDMYDTGFCLAILRGLVTALIVAAIAWPVGDFFSDPRLTVVMLALAVGTLISAFENIGIVDFRRDLAFRKEFDMQFRSRIVGVVTTIATAVIWHSYWALVAGILVNRVARLAQSYSLSPYRPRVTLRAWRRIIGFSLWTWAQTMLYQARDRSDSIVVGRFMGAADVGAFSVGQELGSLPTTEILEPLMRALFSGFAALHDRIEDLSALYLNAVGLGFLLILPAGIGISMVADPLVRLSLGVQWISAVPVVQIIAISGTIAIFGYASGNLLNALGRPNVTFYCITVSTVVRIVLLLLLVPPLGLEGAALALALVVVVDLALLLWQALPRIGVSVRRLVGRIVRPVVATALMVLVLWQMNLAWTPASGSDAAALGMNLATRSSIGAAIYALALLTVWLAVGRPDGAERTLLTIMGQVWSKICLAVKIQICGRRLNV